MFTTKDDYKAHLANDCDMVEVECEICENRVMRGKHLLNDHKPGLEKLVESLRSEVKSYEVSVKKMQSEQLRQ